MSNEIAEFLKTPLGRLFVLPIFYSLIVAIATGISMAGYTGFALASKSYVDDAIQSVRLENKCEMREIKLLMYYREFRDTPEIEERYRAEISRKIVSGESFLKSNCSAAIK